MIKTHYRNTILRGNPKNDYETRDFSAEAQICINCKKKKCNGDCKDFYAARKKLREEDKIDN